MKSTRSLSKRSWIPALAGMTIVVVVFTLYPLPFTLVHSQGVPTSVQGIDLKVSNDNPSPGQTITITVESFISDLNSSDITWTVDGGSRQNGVGLTSIQVTAPALGKNKLVRVSVLTADGRPFSNSVSIGSGILDLIIETDGYVPPFFRGKVPLAYQNSYRIVAFPHLADSTGNEYDPKTLVYTWQKDSKAVPDQSGYGKQVFSWKEEVVPRQRVITVKAMTRDGRAQAERTVILQAIAPSITFYRDDPLYGPLYNSAVGNRVNLGKSGELSILAVPYGFNKPSSGIGDLSFSWMVNSGLQPALSESQSITLRAPGNASGSSEIGLSIKNLKDILQGAQGGFTSTFTKQETAAQSGADDTNFNGI